MNKTTDLAAATDGGKEQNIPKEGSSNRKKYLIIGGSIFAIIALGVGLGVGLYTTIGNISGIQSFPLVKPPMIESAPAAFKTDTSGGSGRRRLRMTEQVRKLADFDLVEVQSRFFLPGPANMWAILSDVDTTTTSFNNNIRSQTCLTNSPVTYPLNFVGENTMFYGQCYYGNSEDFYIYGLSNNNTEVYIYRFSRETHVASKVTIDPADSTVQAVDVWYSVGIGMNRTGSYAVVRIHGDPKVGKFEMTAGGIGIGFAGVTISTDGTSINITGSTGQPTATLCADASNLTASAVCSVSSNTFTLKPLGLKAGFTAPNSCAEAGQPPTCNTVGFGQPYAPSYYPGGDQNVVTISGGIDDAIHFGPNTRIDGLSDWTSGFGG